MANGPLLTGCILGCVSVLALIIGIATEFWLTAEYKTNSAQPDSWVKVQAGLFSITKETGIVSLGTDGDVRYAIDEPNGWIVWTRVCLVLSVLVSGIGTLVAFFASCGAGGKIAEHVATLYHVGTGLGSLGVVIFTIHLYAYKEPGRRSSTPAAGNEIEEESIAELYDVSWSMWVTCASLLFNGFAGVISKKATHSGY